MRVKSCRIAGAKGYHGNQLFGLANFPLLPLGDLRANGFGGEFDGFGGDVQTGQYRHWLARRGERHLAAHHRLHAPDAGRGFHSGDSQFGVDRLYSAYQRL